MKCYRNRDSDHSHYLILAPVVIYESVECAFLSSENIM